jgi:hypothetical protein
MSGSPEEKDKPFPFPNRPLSWLKLKRSENQDSTSTRDPTQAIIDVKVGKSVADGPNPVSFFVLFRSVSISVPYRLRFLHRYSPRFSTCTEVILNALGLIAAVAAGAAQVCFLDVFCYVHHFPTDGCFGSLS